MISVVDNALHQLMIAAWNMKAEAQSVDMAGWRFVDQAVVTQQDDGAFLVRVIEPDAPEPKPKRKAAPVIEPPEDEGPA